MLVFNIKQVNLEYILRRTKQNLKHATLIKKLKKLHTLTEPNLARSKKFLKQKINIPNIFKE
jgi:hypothetical protein